MPENEKTHAQAIAGDIFNMIVSARESGLDLSQGFQNEPLSTKRLTLRYLFYTKKALASVPMPPETKRRLAHSNVLAMIELNGKPLGIHLICALPKPFAKVEAEDEVVAAIHPKGLDAYSEQLRQAMTEEFHQAEQDASKNKDKLN